MNAVQAAATVGVTERTVRRWIESGKLPAEKVSGQFVIDPVHLPLHEAGPISELDALRIIDRTLAALDEHTAWRVLKWANDKWKPSYLDA